MNKPPKGHYQKIIGSQYPSVILAFTEFPIIGCRRVDPTPILQILDNSTDEHAKFYSDGLRNGTIAAIVEAVPDRYFKVGELFFNT